MDDGFFFGILALPCFEALQLLGSYFGETEIAVKMIRFFALGSDVLRLSGIKRRQLHLWKSNKRHRREASSII